MRAFLAGAGMIAGLTLPIAIVHGLKAETSRPQYCLTEGWHFDAGPVRDQVIAQCLGKVAKERDADCRNLAAYGFAHEKEQIYQTCMDRPSRR